MTTRSRFRLRLQCVRCAGRYGYSASVVTDSRALLALGCPGSLYECPPAFFASLLPAGPSGSTGPSGDANHAPSTALLIRLGAHGHCAPDPTGQR